MRLGLYANSSTKCAQISWLVDVFYLLAGLGERAASYVLDAKYAMWNGRGLGTDNVAIKGAKSIKRMDI